MTSHRIYRPKTRRTHPRLSNCTQIRPTSQSQQLCRCFTCYLMKEVKEDNLSLLTASKQQLTCSNETRTLTSA